MLAELLRVLAEVREEAAVEQLDVRWFVAGRSPEGVLPSKVQSPDQLTGRTVRKRLVQKVDGHGRKLGNECYPE